jgi:Uma2 family endonuclease
VLTEELGLPVKSGGSVTLRRRLRKRGIEADECFWIANAKQMAGKRRLDLETDPPPDLAIEVQVTHSALDRLGIYATLGVPEVWWLRRNKLTFYLLEDDSYSASRPQPVLSSINVGRSIGVSQSGAARRG